MTCAELAAAESVIAIGGVQGITPALHRTGETARRPPPLLQLEQVRYFGIEIFGVPTAPPPRQPHRGVPQFVHVLMVNNRKPVGVHPVADEAFLEVMCL